MAEVLTRPYERDLQATLERERMRLRQSLGWLENAERLLSQSQADESTTGGDQADLATDMAEQTLDVTIEQIEREHLAEVESALHKLDEENYGACEKCGRAIEPERLVALPWATSCIRCSHRARSYRQRGFGA
jgi:RNA polymerase-binding protein DksA